MAKPNLTAARLREILNYDPETGVFIWLVSKRGWTKQGGVAGSVSDQGYAKIKIDQRAHKAHRLAWLYVYGEWPQHEIDHINGIRLDNRITNLRDVPTQVNRQNIRRAYVGSQTGVLGVFIDKRRNGCYAQVRVDYKTCHIGHYETVEDAHAAYLEEKRRLHEGCTI